MALLTRSPAAGLLLGSILFSCERAVAAVPLPEAPLLRAIAAAESSLRDGELQSAESHYRTALQEGWQLSGDLAMVEGRVSDARDAFRLASVSAADGRRALRSLVLAQLQLREAHEAVGILTRLLGKNPKDLPLRKLLAQAMVADGQTGQAVQELEEAYAGRPDDLELAFMLALGYLRQDKVDLAERLFARLVEARPIARTRVLIGRTYRDFGQYERARAELRAALAMDPRVRHAHYHLGIVAMVQPPSQLEQAIAEFQAEVKLFPSDTAANLELGMALVDAQRPEEALPRLELVVRSEPPQALTYYHLGRCQRALGRLDDARQTLERALELAPSQAASDRLLRLIHGQLGSALRELGREDEAAPHFADAKRLRDRESEAEKQQLDRQLAGAPDPDAAAVAFAPLAEDSPLAALTPAQRVDLRRRVATELARAYLNLGVMQVQAERFARAVEHLERAAATDPGLPNVQYSLGVAYFNARQFEKAADPLARALEASPADLSLRRMLATSLVNAGAYERAVALLQADPERARDPSLEFAYGLALARSGRAAQAQQVFKGLLTRHGESPELNVMLGQVHAQEGDFEAAIEVLKRALQAKPDVAEANATLGVIYLKQGKLPEAEEALRAQLRSDPKDVQSAERPRDGPGPPGEAGRGPAPAAQRAEVETRLRRRPLPAGPHPARAGRGRGVRGEPRGGGPRRARGPQHPLPARTRVPGARAQRRRRAGVRDVPRAQGQEPGDAVTSAALSLSVLLLAAPPPQQTTSASQPKTTAAARRTSDLKAIAALLEKGDTAAAERRLQQIIASTGDPGARALLARLRFEQKRDAEAVAELRQAALAGPLPRDLGLRLAAAELADGHPCSRSGSCARWRSATAPCRRSSTSRACRCGRRTRARSPPSRGPARSRRTRRRS